MSPPMTVATLLAELKALPGNMLVVVCGIEDGEEAAFEVCRARVLEHVAVDSYYGDDVKGVLDYPNKNYTNLERKCLVLYPAIKR